MPRQVDHELRRREIAQATWRAVGELGAGGVTMRAIAEAAGCTTGRLTHYFANREEVLLAALSFAYEGTSARMAVAVESRSGIDALRAVLYEALPLDEGRRTECKVWITFWAQAIATEPLRTEHRRRYEAWYRLLTKLVRAARPDLSRSDARLVAEGLAGLVDGLAIQGIMAPSSATSRRLRHAVDRAIHGYLSGE